MPYNDWIVQVVRQPDSECLHCCYGLTNADEFVKYARAGDLLWFADKTTRRIVALATFLDIEFGKSLDIVIWFNDYYDLSNCKIPERLKDSNKTIRLYMEYYDWNLKGEYSYLIRYLNPSKKTTQRFS